MHDFRRESNSVCAAPEFDRRAAGWLPYAVLGLASLVLWLNWDSIPDRWIVHWNARGEPDGWLSKSPAAVFSPVILGTLLCLMLEGVKRLAVWQTTNRVDKRISREVAMRFAAMTGDLLFVIQTALAVAFSLAAIVLPLVRRTSPGLLVGGLLLIVAAASVIGIGGWQRSARAMKDADLLKGLEGWHGLIYRNEADPRIWVPKLTGMGYTLNFARLEAWLLLAAFLCIPLLALVVILVRCSLG